MSSLMGDWARFRQKRKADPLRRRLKKDTVTVQEVADQAQLDIFWLRIHESLEGRLTKYEKATLEAARSVLIRIADEL